MRKHLHQSRWLIGLLLSSMVLLACGQKGPLRHPDENSQLIEVAK